MHGIGWTRNTLKGNLVKSLIVLAILTLDIYYIAKLLFPNKEVGNEEKLNRQFTQAEQKLI